MIATEKKFIGILKFGIRISTTLSHVLIVPIVYYYTYIFATSFTSNLYITNLVSILLSVASIFLFSITNSQIFIFALYNLFTPENENHIRRTKRGKWALFFTFLLFISSQFAEFNLSYTSSFFLTKLISFDTTIMNAPNMVKSENDKSRQMVLKELNNQLALINKSRENDIKEMKSNNKNLVRLAKEGYTFESKILSGKLNDIDKKYNLKEDKIKNDYKEMLSVLNNDTKKLDDAINTKKIHIEMVKKDISSIQDVLYWVIFLANIALFGFAVIYVLVVTSSEEQKSNNNKNVSETPKNVSRETFIGDTVSENKDNVSRETDVESVLRKTKKDESSLNKYNNADNDKKITYINKKGETVVTTYANVIRMKNVYNNRAKENEIKFKSGAGDKYKKIADNNMVMATFFKNILIENNYNEN